VRAPGAAELPLRRIVVCGFRPATVGLLEALVLAEPLAEILVLVDDEATLAAAIERFREHRNLAEYRMLTLSPGASSPRRTGASCISRGCVRGCVRPGAPGGRRPHVAAAARGPAARVRARG
jgi:hypothetical protein